MNLNEYLKYSMNTVENLLAQLHQNPLARFPQQEPVNPTNEHTLQRNVTADALDDAGRSREAELLRDPKQHVVVHNGQVRAGRFTDRQVERKEMTALNELAANIGQRPPEYPNMFWSQDDDAPDGHLLITHRAYHPDDTVHAVHISQLGHYLAGALSGVADTRNVNFGDPEGWEKLLENVRNAPYEEVDHRHPSEAK